MLSESIGVIVAERLLLHKSWVDVEVVLEGRHPTRRDSDFLATGWARERVGMMLHEILETGLAEGVRTGQQLGARERSQTE